MFKYPLFTYYYFYPMRRKILSAASAADTLLRLHQNQYTKLNQETSLNLGSAYLSRCDGR